MQPNVQQVMYVCEIDSYSYWCSLKVRYGVLSTCRKRCWGWRGSGAALMNDRLLLIWFTLCQTLGSIAKIMRQKYAACNISWPTTTHTTT